jgi:hypothetical protein
VDNSEEGAPAAADEGAAPAAAGEGAPPPKLELQPGEGAREFGARIFEAVFAADVRRLLAMSTLWKERRPPVPLSLAELVPDLAGLPVASPEDDLAVWSVAENAAAFVGAVVRVQISVQTPGPGNGLLDSQWYALYILLAQDLPRAHGYRHHLIVVI